MFALERRRSRSRVCSSAHRATMILSQRISKLRIANETWFSNAMALSHYAWFGRTIRVEDAIYRSRPTGRCYLPPQCAPTATPLRA